MHAAHASAAQRSMQPRRELALRLADDWPAPKNSGAAPTGAERSGGALHHNPLTLPAPAPASCYSMLRCAALTSGVQHARRRPAHRGRVCKAGQVYVVARLRTAQRELRAPAAGIQRRPGGTRHLALRQHLGAAWAGHGGGARSRVGGQGAGRRAVARGGNLQGRRAGGGATGYSASTRDCRLPVHIKVRGCLSQRIPCCKTQLCRLAAPAPASRAAGGAVRNSCSIRACSPGTCCRN